MQTKKYQISVYVTRETDTIFAGENCHTTADLQVYYNPLSESPGYLPRGCITILRPRNSTRQIISFHDGNQIRIYPLHPTLDKTS